MTEVTGILPTTLTVGLRRTQTKQNKKAATTKAWKRDLFFPPPISNCQSGLLAPPAKLRPCVALVSGWGALRVCPDIECQNFLFCCESFVLVFFNSGWLVRTGGVFLGGWHPVGDPWRPINCWHPTVPCGSLYLILILLTLLLLLTLLPALLPTVPCGQIR